MKKILFLLLLLVPIAAFSQLPFEMGSIKVDSIYMNESSDWWDEISTSTKLAGATNSQVPTALAVKTFVIDTVAKIVADSIAAIDFTTTSLQDSIDKHTDTLQLHNTRIKVLSDTTASHNTRIKANKTSITSVLDSIGAHQDTLQLHNTRIKVLEAAGGGSGTIDTTGLPVANEFAIFTAAAMLGSTNNLKLSSDTVVISSSKGLSLHDSLYLKYLKLAAGDTVALLAIGAAEKIDSASLVPAAKAWTDKLEPFDVFYDKSSSLQALPLPYPNGSERRQPNAMYMSYQFEYELERSAQYMKQLFDRVRLLEKENARLNRKPKRKDFKELLLRVESLEKRVDGLEQKVCR